MSDNPVCHFEGLFVPLNIVICDMIKDHIDFLTEKKIC